ncbi:carbonate dehydratase [Thiomicrorhabdus sp.]|uniref:carbonate dehydratase n=1 Tax=Thiomicrorhabdus sp. TaxID=2039724 RepID=UPI002AA6EE60|nr:carbonate dehydratase [Thiomicrorhabdus sp.]
MIRKNPTGDMPSVHASAFVDPTAILCGKIIVEENVFIGPYAVIRADETNDVGEMEPIIIGAHSNIQDGVVIHSKAGAEVNIGERTSIAHRSIVHGPCNVGSDVFIGFNSVLFNCCVADQVVVRHNSVIEGCTLPTGLYVPSTTHIDGNSDLSQFSSKSADMQSFSESVVNANHELVGGYKRIQNEL